MPCIKHHCWWLWLLLYYLCLCMYNNLYANISDYLHAIHTYIHVPTLWTWPITVYIQYLDGYYYSSGHVTLHLYNEYYMLQQSIRLNTPQTYGANSNTTNKHKERPSHSEVYWTTWASMWTAVTTDIIESRLNMDQIIERHMWLSQNTEWKWYMDEVLGHNEPTYLNTNLSFIRLGTGLLQVGDRMNCACDWTSENII